MDIKVIEKDKVYVIGKMGEGASNSNSTWIQELWDDANNHFNEIKDIAKLDKNGHLVGFWGVMTDIDELFLPWSWQGKYLAGCEVNKEAEAPKGWTKIVIPAFKYIAVKCKKDEYQKVFEYITNDYLPKHKYSLVGALQEFYDANDNYDTINLLFPIEFL